MGELFERLLKTFRHPLRFAATLTAALAVVLGFAGNWALAGLVIGVGGGIFAGEVLGRSRTRLPVALGGPSSFGHQWSAGSGTKRLDSPMPAPADWLCCPPPPWVWD